MNRDSRYFVFSTQLGWMALEMRGERVLRLVFGYRDRNTAIKAIGAPAGTIERHHPLIERLQLYAEGVPDEFLDVEIEYQPTASFTRRVLEACRRIPLGETISYAELARRAGSPGAARAAGQAMANNLVPILIPCHRVVASGGGLGGYGAPGGLATKRRLLALEAQTRLIGTAH